MCNSNIDSILLLSLILHTNKVTWKISNCVFISVEVVLWGVAWSSGQRRSLQLQGSRVRIPVSPSFLREWPEEKSREKSSRIVNERERDDVDIRSTGGKVAREAGGSGMATRTGSVRLEND